MKSNTRSFVHGPLGSKLVLFTLALAACSQAARAADIWNESLHGDLSGNRLAPTTLGGLALGDNTLIGVVQGGDLDYFTFSVPAGQTLSAIVLLQYTSADQRAFVGVQHGSVFTEPAAGANVANLLGWTHIGPGGAPQGTDILDNLGAGPGAQGFAGALPAGDYVFWVQQLGAETLYRLDFQTVPAPGSVGLLLAAATMTRRRRR
jgi:hypothetical protein